MNHDLPSPVHALRATMPIIVAIPIAVAGAVAEAPDTAHAASARGVERATAQTPGQRVATTDAIAASHTTTAALASARSTPTAAAPQRVPSTYTVQRGDTVAGVAARYGLSTPAVLALNGLGWRTVIHPGQVLRLTAAGPAAASSTNSTTAAVAATTTAAAPAVERGYTVVRGDTVSAIAARFGVGVDAIAQRNNLSDAGVVFAGQRIVIPAAAAAAAHDASATTALTPAMAANARTIVAVGRRIGVPDRGIVVALAAAAQESGLLNLPNGDRDSVGVFQQRPSTGWGTPAQLLDVDYAARLFYGGPSNPNRGTTSGLLDVPGWQRLSVTQAAQAVQRSATPEAYARWEPSATAWLAQLG